MRVYDEVRWWCRKKLGLLVSSFLLLSAVVIFINYQYSKVRAELNGGKDLSEIRSISYPSNRPERDDPSTTTSPRPLSRKDGPTAAISSSSRQPLSYNTVENDDCPANGGGFTLALSFHDQQTWAFGNLLSLQNWAASLNLTVLQPFLVSTNLGVPLRGKELQSQSTLPLSALYDMDYWNNDGKQKGYSLAVPWNCFLRRAPRRLVLVHTDVVVRTCETEQLRSRAQYLTGLPGFIVTREFCLAKVTTPTKRLSVDEFNRKILGNVSAREATVVFSEWSQNTVGSLLDLDTAHVPMALSRTLPLRPSYTITRDADNYISRFLHDGHFVAVLFRSEWLTMYSSLPVFNETLRRCLAKTLDYIQSAKEKTSSEAVFLGLDVGKYGSATIEQEKGDLAREMFDKTLLPSTQFQSFSAWEQSFESVSQYSVPGYVALLQRTVAVRANCLLLMGSGSFLKQALEQYMARHRLKRCYLETDGKCNAFKRVHF